MREDLRQAWTALTDDLDGDVQAVRRFFVAYRDLVVPRVDAAAVALARGDDEEARSTLLTVRSTSLMVGAAEVGDAASAVLDRHRARHRTTADEARALATLRAAARSACDEVALLLGDPPPAVGQPVGSNR
ncbi:hypothetical protein G8C93_11540 [Cellulosimicrobium cellulans]|uniref:hypothetical protein n=1 Tax=Cellulosimicrobium cellulans TaxID=1710 RepID=UPI00188387E8|nr:hypothetical protein [Cellulosimicrobium cellulans]MBE9926517.1 hypothetical protein [Cellulosimicrobium cellulans]